MTNIETQFPGSTLWNMEVTEFDQQFKYVQWLRSVEACTVTSNKTPSLRGLSASSGWILYFHRNAVSRCFIDHCFEVVTSWRLLLSHSFRSTYWSRTDAWIHNLKKIENYNTCNKFFIKTEFLMSLDIAMLAVYIQQLFTCSSKAKVFKVCVL